MFPHLCVQRIRDWKTKQIGIPCVNAYKSIFIDKVIEVMTQGITKFALWMNTCEQLGGKKYIWI
jgi:hypothetical protein